MKNYIKALACLAILISVSCNSKNSNDSDSNVLSSDSVKIEPEIEYLVLDTTYEFDTGLDLNRAILYMDSGYLFVRGNDNPYWNNMDKFITFKIDTASRNILDISRGVSQDNFEQSLHAPRDVQNNILMDKEVVKLNDSTYATYVISGRAEFDREWIEYEGQPRVKSTLNLEKSKFVGTLTFIKSNYEHIAEYHFGLTQFYFNADFKKVDNIVFHDGYLLIETNDDSLRLFNYSGDELLKVGDNNSRVKEFNFYDFVRDENQTFILRTKINENMQLLQLDNSTGQVINSNNLNCRLSNHNINSFSLIEYGSNLLVSFYTQILWIDKKSFKILWQKNLSEIGASSEYYGESDSWSAPVIYKNLIIQEFTTRSSEGFEPNLCVIDYTTAKVLKTYRYGPHHNEFGLKILNGYLYYIEQSYDSYYKVCKLNRIKLNI